VNLLRIILLNASVLFPTFFEWWFRVQSSRGDNIQTKKHYQKLQLQLLNIEKPKQNFKLKGIKKISKFYQAIKILF